MTPRRWWILGISAGAVIAAILATVLFQLRQTAPLHVRMDLTEKGTALRTVTVYYLEPDSPALVPLEREVLASHTREELVKELIAQLAEAVGKYQPVLPQGTRLLHYFEDGEGEAVMDLSAEIELIRGTGIREERLRLSAFTRTLAENLEGIQRVQLLSLGRPLSRWGSHLKPSRSVEVGDS